MVSLVCPSAAVAPGLLFPAVSGAAGRCSSRSAAPLPQFVRPWWKVCGAGGVGLGPWGGLGHDLVWEGGTKAGGFTPRRLDLR